MADHTAEPRQPSEKRGLAFVFGFKLIEEVVALSLRVVNLIDYFCEHRFEKHFDDKAANEGRGAGCLSVWFVAFTESDFFFGRVPGSERKLTLLLVLHLLSNHGTIAAFDDFPSDSYVAHLIEDRIPERTVGLSILASGVEPGVVVLVVASCVLDQE